MAKAAEYNLGPNTFPRGWFIVAESKELNDGPMSDMSTCFQLHGNSRKHMNGAIFLNVTAVLDNNTPPISTRRNLACLSFSAVPALYSMTV